FTLSGCRTAVRLLGHLASTTRRLSRLPDDADRPAVHSALCPYVCGIEAAATHQHRPSDARQLIGKRHHHRVLVSSRHKSHHPSSEGRVAPDQIGQYRPGTVDQVLAQISIAPLADTKQAWFATSGCLTRHQ